MDKFPLNNDGGTGLNLEFKFKCRVYYINTNKRIVRTEQYNNIEVEIPTNINIPNFNTLEEDFVGRDFYTRIEKLEYSLSGEYSKFKDLQDFLLTIDWEFEKEKKELQFQIESFIESYGEEEFNKLLKF